MIKEKLFSCLLIFGVAVSLISCNEGGDSEGYFFEDQEDGIEEQLEVELPQDLQDPRSGGTSTIEIPDDMDPDSIPEIQDKEPEPSTVKDLIAVNTTDGKLDTAKLTATILNALVYLTKQPMGASFTCDNFAYFGSNIMIPIKKNENFSSAYLQRDFAGKRYHFMVLNYRGYVSGKNYVVDCSRNDYNYKELFIFYPEDERRTQSSLILAVADEYLKDVETLININWSVGEEDAKHRDYGVVQFKLKKLIPGA